MNDSEDMRRIFRPLIQRWYIIVLGAILGTGKGLKDFNESVPSYQCRATIQINDKHSSLSKYMEDFEDFSMTGKYEVELSFMRSKHVAWEGLRTLDVEVYYFRHERAQFRNLYGKIPFRVAYAFRNKELKDQLFELELKEGGTLRLSPPHGEDEEAIFIEGKLGEWIRGQGFKVKIVPDSLALVNDPKAFQPDRYAFQVNSKQGLLETLASLDLLWIRLQNEKTPIINLYTWSEVPELAADVANAVAYAYLRFYLDNKLGLAGLSLEAIDQQLKAIQERMIEMDHRIADFQSRHLAWNLDNALKNNKSMLKKLNAVRLSHQFHFNDLSTLEAGISEDSLTDQIPQTYGALRDQRYIAGIREWEKWRQKRKELMQVYTEIHPEMIRLDKLLTDIADDIHGQMERTKAQQDLMVDEVDRKLEEKNGRILELIELEKELLALQREAEDLELAYMEMIDKRTEAVVSAAADFHFHRMLEHAYADVEPIKPHFHVMVGLNGLRGALAAILFIVLYRLALSRMSHESDLSIHSKLPHIATVHDFPLDIDQTCQEMITLASDLYLQAGIHWINITSYRHGEGKSATAIHLAKSLAALDQRTLLIDADPFRPTAQAYFGLDERLGLTQFLHDPEHPSSYVLPTSIVGLDVLGTGWMEASSPSQLLHHAALPSIIQTLRQKYDYIVVDVTVLRGTQDALAMLRRGDITICTVKNHKSTFSQMKKAEQILNDLPAPNPHILYWWKKRKSKQEKIWDLPMTGK